MSKKTSLEVAALIIEGTNLQIETINRHKKKWDAELQLDDELRLLTEWGIKKIDNTRSALFFPLGDFDTVFNENLGASAKNLTFLTSSLKASEVLLPLINNGMKVKVVTPNKQEFTLKKSSIALLNKNAIEHRV